MVGIRSFPFGMAYFQGLLLLVSGRVAAYVSVVSMSTLRGAQHWKEASHWCTGQPKAHVFQAVNMEETWVDSQFLGRLKIESQKTFIPKWSLWLFGWAFKISALRQSALLLQIPKVQDDVVLRWPRFLDYSGLAKSSGMARFILIAYIASGHFIHTATKNPFLLRMITQDGRRPDCGLIWRAKKTPPKIHDKNLRFHNVQSS